METVQLVDSLLGIIRALKHYIRCSLGLEIRVCTETDLPDGSVLAKEVVQVGTGNVEVAEDESDLMQAYYSRCLQVLDAKNLSATVI